MKITRQQLRKIIIQEKKGFGEKFLDWASADDDYIIARRTRHPRLDAISDAVNAAKNEVDFNILKNFLFTLNHRFANRELIEMTESDLRRIIREAEGSTKKYDTDSALKGGQSKLPDGLQKGIIDKTVEDREEYEEEEREEKNESARIIRHQIRRIIKEEKADLLNELTPGDAGIAAAGGGTPADQGFAAAAVGEYIADEILGDFVLSVAQELTDVYDERDAHRVGSEDEFQEQIGIIMSEVEDLLRKRLQDLWSGQLHVDLWG